MGVKKGWREGKLDRRRRTPVQPESAMRGGTEEKEARAEADVVVSACVEGMLGGDRLTGDEGVRPRHRAREGRRLDRRRGKVKAVRVQTKGADKVRGVRRVRGESVVR